MRGGFGFSPATRRLSCVGSSPHASAPSESLRWAQIYTEDAIISISFLFNNKNKSVGGLALQPGASPSCKQQKCNE